MTHISERDFVDEFLVPWLGTFFSDSSIATEYRLPSDRRVDVLVQTPFFDIAVEAENDAGSFDVGAGQALGYMKELEKERGERPLPVLAVPLDPENPDAHREAPEFGIARSILRDLGGDIVEVRTTDPTASERIA